MITKKALLFLRLTLVTSLLSGSATLSGCGESTANDVTPGTSSSAGGQESAVNATYFQGAARFGPNIPAGQVALYGPAGTLLYTGPLDESGGYSFGPIQSANFQPEQEYSVNVTLADGTLLQAQAPSTQAHLSVNEISSLVVRYRNTHPGLTLQQSIEAVKHHLEIPDSIDLADVGGDDSPLSLTLFDQAVTAGGTANSGLDAQARAVDGTPTSAYRRSDVTWEYLGINSLGFDTPGGTDPDLTTNAPNPLLVDNLATNPYPGKNASDAISSAASTVKDTKSIKDILGPKSVAGRALSGVGLVGSLLNFGVQVYAIYTEAEDPVLQAIGNLDNKISSLALQLQALRGYLDWSNANGPIAALRPALDSENVDLKTVALQNQVVDSQVIYTAPPFQTLYQIQGFQARKAAETVLTYLQPEQWGSSTGAVSAFCRLLMARIGAPVDFSSSTYTTWNNYSFRTNDLTLLIRDIIAKYILLLDRALLYDVNESNTYQAMFADPSVAANSVRARQLGGQIANDSQNSLAAQNGYAYRRRLALQQSPLRFASDKVGYSPQSQIVWSLKECRSLNFNDFKDSAGFYLPTYIFYVPRIYPKWLTGFEIDPTFNKSIYWRLPTYEELKTLPGFAGGDSAFPALKQAGFDLPPVDTILCEDKNGPSGDDNDGTVKFFNVYFGQNLRLVNFKSGRPYKASEVKSNWSIGLLRLASLYSCAQTFAKLSETGLPTLNAATLAQIPNFPNIDSDKLLYSEFLLQAGVKPWRIYAVPAQVLDPLYRGNDAFPKSFNALSAIAVWKVDAQLRFASPLTSTLYVCCDVSGYVAWNSSDSKVAVVLNNANYRDNIRYDQLLDNQGKAGFVSRNYAPVLWSKAEAFQATAVWAQGVEDPTGQTCTISPPLAAPDYQCPAYIRSLSVNPTNLVFTRFSDAQVLSFHAIAGSTDRRQRDLSTQCQWFAFAKTDSYQGPLPPEWGTVSSAGTVQLTQEVVGKKFTLTVTAVDPVSQLFDSANLLMDLH